MLKCQTWGRPPYGRVGMSCLVGHRCLFLPRVPRGGYPGCVRTPPWSHRSVKTHNRRVIAHIAQACALGVSTGLEDQRASTRASVPSPSSSALFSRGGPVSTCVRAGSRGAAADHGDGGAAGVRGLRVDRSRRRGRDDRCRVRTRCGRRPVGRAGVAGDARGCRSTLEAARSAPITLGGSRASERSERDGHRQSRRARALGRRLSPRSRGSSCGTTTHDAQRRGRVRSSRGCRRSRRGRVGQRPNSTPSARRTPVIVRRRESLPPRR